jgi:hypothetical protein
MRNNFKKSILQKQAPEFILKNKIYQKFYQILSTEFLQKIKILNTRKKCLNHRLQISKRH